MEKAFHRSKCAGYKNLQHRTADAYAGLSKRQVLKCVLGHEYLRKFNVKFVNRKQNLVQLQ